MKSLVLAALVLTAVTFSNSAQASPVYNSKATVGSIPQKVELSDAAARFDNLSANSKLGSQRAGTESLNVLMATERAECTKCSS